MEKLHIELNQAIFKGYLDDPLEEFIFNKKLLHQNMGEVAEGLHLEQRNKFGDQKMSRNDPCFCGSGKKFKKCCIFLKVSTELETVTFEDLKKLLTPKILEQLGNYGIQTSQDEFLELLQKNSPREIFTFWEYLAKDSLDLKGRLYFQNAIKLLIERWCPNQAYYQKWEENLKAGYGYLDAQDEIMGIYYFSKAWENIRKKITPEMKKFHDVDEILLLEEPFSNFVNDYEISFSNDLLSKKEYREKALQFCQQIFEQFQEEDPSQLEHIQLTQARCHLFEGAEDQAEKIYQEMIHQYPKRAAGYVGWIDSLTWMRTFMKKPEDQARASFILDQAKAVGVEDGDAWDLERRMNDF